MPPLPLSSAMPRALPLLLLVFLAAPLQVRAVALTRSLLAARNAANCPVFLPDVAPPDAGQTRIVGGQPATDFIRSHLVSFHAEGCGASLISKRWAITAAHCLVKTSSRATIAGTDSNNGVAVPIKAVYTHPSYDLPKNDISLVEFAEDVPSSANFVRVNTNPAIPELGEFGRVAGYGFTAESNNPNTGSDLFQVDVPAVLTETCKTAYEDVKSFLAEGISDSLHICAGYDAGKCDSCTADSGGPLVVYAADKRPIQIAIVSFGYGCARPKIPGGYTRLSTYVSWMESVGAEFETATEREAVFLEGFGPSGTNAPATSAPTTTASATTTATDPPETTTATTLPSSTSTETTAPSTATSPSTSDSTSGPSATTITTTPSQAPTPTDSPSGTTSPTTQPSSATSAKPSTTPDAQSGSSGDGAGASTATPTTTGSTSGSTDGGANGNPTPTPDGYEPGLDGGGGGAAGSGGASVNSGSGNGSGKSDEGAGGGVNVGAAVGTTMAVLAIIGALALLLVRRRRNSVLGTEATPTVGTEPRDSIA